jgi:hypothetical protein
LLPAVREPCPGGGRAARRAWVLCISVTLHRLLRFAHGDGSPFGGRMPGCFIGHNTNMVGRFPQQNRGAGSAVPVRIPARWSGFR